MEKPVLDLDQIELNGIRIFEAYEQGATVRIKYFAGNDLHDLVCNIDKPINIWDMIIRCSNSDGKINIPFSWIIRVECIYNSRN